MFRCPSPARSRALIALAGAVLASCVGTEVAVAHTDDPKLLPIAPVFAGPGYRAADGPLAGLPLYDAEHMTLQSWITLDDFDSEGAANDCWGYTSPSGREYALMGLRDGLSVVEITDPARAEIIEKIPGAVGTWRDVKTFGTYAYIVSEVTDSGIQILDLSRVDIGEVTLVNTVLDFTELNRAHNVAINTASGRLYRCGGNGHGLRIYSLEDPVNPTFLGAWEERYVHDAQIVTMTSGPWAGREIAFCCAGFNSGWVEPGFDIVDVTDPTAPVVLGTTPYPNAVYSHQGWLSEDGTLFYLGDEIDENDFGLPTTTLVFDVSDLTQPQLVNTFTNGNTATGHNMYVRGDLLFQANYQSGVRVFDVGANPIAPPEVAYFDTYPEDDGTGYGGVWSVYPYFASGTVIASDRQRGLFVFELELADPADLNEDGVIGLDDLLVLLANWGTCLPVPPACRADLTGDGTVDFNDLLQLLGVWSGG